MTEHISVGRLARDLHAASIEVRRASPDSSDQRVRLSFPASSETPVERFFGTEVLVHDKSAVRLERINAGAAPLLFNHDWSDPIGVIEGGRIEDGRMVVDAVMFTTERAREVALMVEQGLRNVSVGYEIDELEEDAQKRGVFRATRWTPLEVSVVTVPADIRVGIGRDADGQQRKVRVVRAGFDPAASAAFSGASTMDEQKQAAGNTAAEVQQHPASAPAQPRSGPSAMELEQARIRAIDALVKANNIDKPVRDMWVNSGVGMDEIAADILRIVEERGRTTAKPASALGLSRAEAQRFSLMRAIQAASSNNWTQAGYELECSREIAKRLNKVPDPNKFYVPVEVQTRDLTAGTGSAGGFLVGTQNMSFIELMRNRSVVYRMGAQRMSGLSGNVTIPRQTAAATAYWLATEATAITESQQTLGQLSLTPKTVGAYTEISRQLMLQSSPDAETMVSNDLATVCALAVDVGALRGSGSGGEPTGIVNTAGIGSVTGTSLGAAGVLEFQSDVAGGNLLSETCGYVTTPAVAALLMARPELPSTGTTRLWNGNMLEGSLFGLRAMTSIQMSAATMLFGDFSKVVIAEWNTLEIEVNPYANFQAGIVGVRAMVTVDVGVRYGGAFSYASSIT